MDNHKHILMLLSFNDIAGLHCSLAAALWLGASAQTIFGVLESPISGLYHPRGHFTQCEFDVSFLVKALDGPHLLYAL
jgi:hypothetical protein